MVCFGVAVLFLHSLVIQWQCKGNMCVCWECFFSFLFPSPVMQQWDRRMGSLMFTGLFILCNSTVLLPSPVTLQWHLGRAGGDGCSFVSFSAFRFYIGCDLCSNWFHGTCVNITEEQARFIDSYICEDCRKQQENTSEELYCLCRTPYDENQ